MKDLVLNAVGLNPRSKVAIKFFVRSIVGEPYVGKRMKLGYLEQLIRRIPSKNIHNILEVGSSDGLFSAWIAHRFPKATVEALDLNEEEVRECQEWCRSRRLDHRLKFIQLDVLKLETEQKYDLVLALDVLEHIADDSSAIKRIFASMKANAVLIVHVPNKTYQTITGELHEVPDEEAYKINAGHVRQGYFPDRLRTLLTESGFTVEEVFTAHGPMSDLAHRIYYKFENPAILRIATIPLVDVCAFIDRSVKRSFGNTVFAVARKKEAKAAVTSGVQCASTHDFH